MPKIFIPERNDIIWLDFEPTKSKEIGKYRPALVLSSQAYNQQTGLLICSPISTSIRGAKTEVPVKNLDEPSVVASSLIQTLSWKDRKAQFITKAEAGILNEVLLRLLPLIGADALIEKLMNDDKPSK
ncbi:MazF family transcriptional regulator [Photorhabdus temperata]|uniref:MazF family transcriptional regulator n=2 Tax=Photorhabdus TaxID=29487 RepID=A0A7X5TJF5_9GAMM|nr:MULTISPECIES: type II toxin-antitoxin system PemK/MazF family toxin [Photorhabdus]ETS29771.1 growth inhibitor [Photorhabdus khanii NC19]NHB95851.1 MazF family transcriptional regulator [Photorhabdus stackebrandtii]OHV50239.1 MazF family transcriptional regulator [Photorhabdus temperata]